MDWIGFRFAKCLPRIMNYLMLMSNNLKMSKFWKYLRATHILILNIRRRKGGGGARPDVPLVEPMALKV